MGWGRRVFAVCALGHLTLSGCVLLTDLDGLTGGAGNATDGSTDGGTRGPIGDGAAPEEDDAASRPDVVTTSDSAIEAASPGSSAYRREVLADSPSGYWRLGERSGLVAHDEMGAHDGTYTAGVTLGAPGTLAGDPDTATTFGGGGVLIGHDFSFSNRPFTIEAWVKMKPIVVAPGAYAETYILSKAGGNVGMHWYVNSDDKLSADLGSQNGQISAIGAPFPPSSNFRHVVLTYDGSTAYEYIDGAQKGSAQLSRVVGDPSVSLYIGKEDGDRGPLIGTIDEVAIYDHVLPPTRVAVHYTVGVMN